ncbi:tetratricopeptide repeat protein [candidate division KSB1 bacterium]|nr:tetratricopeptide repeat protein [candidate division KSB1 bacterium]
MIKTIRRPLAILLWLMLILVNNTRTQTTNENTDYLYAKRLFDDKMFELAARQFKTFAQNYPTGTRAPEALFMAGDAYLKIQLFEEARQAYLEMTVRFPQAPRNDEAQFRIGDCYAEQRKYQDAAQAYHRVKVFFPKSTLAPTAMIAAGRMFAKAGDLAEALKMFFNFLEEYPQDPSLLPVRLEVVTLLTQKGELARALAEAEKLIAFAYKGDIKFQSLFQKGIILEEMGRLNEAQSEYLNLIKQPIPADLQAKINLRLGYQYRVKGEWARSNEYFVNALKARGDVATQLETFLLLADNYFDLKKFAQAQENYTKVVNIAPKTESYYFEGLYKTALTYQMLADFKNAINFYARFLKEYVAINRKIADYREQSLLQIAQSCLSLGDGASAINYLHQYLTLFPESNLNDQINLKIAEIYELQLQNPEKALRMYDYFMEQFPRSPYLDEAQAGIARSYETIGNYDEALKAYHQFLAIFPGANQYSEIQQRVEKLQQYYLKNPAQALRQLSQLLGEYLINPNRGAQLIKLADLNFDQLKDYRQALTYYQVALEQGAGGKIRDEIYFRMAQAYHRLALQPESLTNQITQPAFIDSARRLYQLVSENYAAGDWADDAAIELAELPTTEVTQEAGSAPDYLQISERFLASPRRDYVLLALAKALMEGRRGRGVDSLQSASFYLQQLITKYPTSSYLCEAYFQKGRHALRMGDQTGARTALETYVEQCRQHRFIVETLYYLAEIARQQQNFDQSLNFYQQIVDQYYYSGYADSAYLKIGQVLLAKGAPQAAREHFLQIEQQFSKLSWSTFDRIRSTMFSADELVFQIAQAYEKSADWTNARLRYQDYLKLAPNGQHVGPTLLALGKITALAGSADTDLALSYFDRLKTESADKQITYSAAIQAADLRFQNEKYAAAREEYLRGVELATTPAEKEFPGAQAIICGYRSDQITLLEQEIENFSRQFGKIPKYLAAFDYEQGDYYFRQKSFENAEKIFTDLRNQYKQTDFAPKAELALGQLYFKTNKDEKAMDIITQIPDKYPDSEISPIALINLGDYYLKEAKQPENAVALYKKALSHPRLGKMERYATQNLIDCYEMLSMHDQVLALTREQLKKYPNDESNFNLRIKIGTTYMDLRQYDLAIAQFEELKQMAGPENEAEIQYRLAECYEFAGQYEKAITEYLKVKYITKQRNDLPWDVTAQYKAALVYQKLKRYDEAQTLFEKIVQSWGAQSDFGRAAVVQLEELKKLRQSN